MLRNPPCALFFKINFTVSSARSYRLRIPTGASFRPENWENTITLSACKKDTHLCILMIHTSHVCWLLCMCVFDLMHCYLSLYLLFIQVSILRQALRKDCDAVWAVPFNCACVTNGIFISFFVLSRWCLMLLRIFLRKKPKRCHKSFVLRTDSNFV
jgi:hypothetical protein